VTLEDVLEEIVGEIIDESDQPTEEIWHQNDGSLHALGTIELHKLCRALDIKLASDTKVSSLGGLVTELLERIPVQGDTVEWNGCRLRVLAANRRSVELIAVSRIPE